MKSREKKPKKQYKMQVYFRRRSDADLVRRAASILDTELSRFIREVVLREANLIISKQETAA